ncbi:phosphoribosylformylglycinamidine cyclo-ligase [Desulfitispora alkaliphila]|uniref:phosphoribosylformylglycinamidine cyclo-ligase n=1 Tax=Desulfitispora alkaliphila TaxID=622674 RepID=UPI003D198C07
MADKKQEKLTYAQAGVDIEAGNEAVSLMKSHVKRTWRPEVLTELGGFGGLFALDKDKYAEPVLVSGTDGVGTKLKVAMMMDKHDTIGIDAVAMCVNDILVQGAEPLFFLDYLAVGKLKPEQVADIVKGIADGCEQSGCALIGGETAEMPGFYSEDEYDVAGFTVGIVDKEKIITGAKIEPGHVLLGLPSSGIHSNGYSLVRKVLLEVAEMSLDSQVEMLDKTLGEELLTPTKIYVKAVMPLLKAGLPVDGMAHITGGGLIENIPRVLPLGTAVEIDTSAIDTPKIFELIQEKGQIEKTEMYRTFNMGVGMVLIVPPDSEEAVRNDLEKRGEKVYTLGKVVAGEGEVKIR